MKTGAQNFGSTMCVQALAPGFLLGLAAVSCSAGEPALKTTSQGCESQGCESQGCESQGFELSAEHLAAVNRPRRVVANGGPPIQAVEVPALIAKVGLERFIKGTFSTIDEKANSADSVWWCWGEGNCALWASKTIKLDPGYQKLRASGIDLVQICNEESKKRGLESFFTFRNNGSDNEYGRIQRIPLKKAHPDWLLHAPWEGPDDNGFWNFAIEGVRQMKVATLREVAENYDFDGIEIDFARGPILLPQGHQWENRHHLTDYMRAVRSMTLGVEEKRGRPFLLAARIPENLVGCHFDGMDVETWIREQLLDILVLGNRALEVDVAAFRRLTAGTAIKLYPCIDPYHASDGYENPPIEVFRGVFANWWHQGADGIQTFNFYLQTPAGAAAIGSDEIRHELARKNRQAYQEMGQPERLRHKDKTFIVERRGGGHGASVVPDPADWKTPRHMYFLTNMFAQLPAPLANDGRADTLLMVYVADDVTAEANQISRITVRALLSDPDAKDIAVSERLEPFEMSCHDQPGGKRPNIPPAKGIENQIELRLNNVLLERRSVEGGWLVFEAQPKQFAVGKNLVGIRVDQRTPEAQSEMLVEMLEVHVDYRRDLNGT